jgi:hypothetical protein
VIIRVFVLTTHRDSGQCERLANNWYVVDEHIAAELAAAGAVRPDFEALDGDHEGVAALVEALFPPPPVPPAEVDEDNE